MLVYIRAKFGRHSICLWAFMEGGHVAPPPRCAILYAFEPPPPPLPPFPSPKRTYFLSHHTPYPKTSEFDLKVFCSNSVQIFSGLFFFS